MEVILKHKHVDYWSKTTKYKGCFDNIGPYFTRSGNVYSGGLTDSERTVLEKKLGYKEGTLASWSLFWDTYSVKLGEKPKVFNLDNPFHELQYLYCKNHKRVAFGIGDKKPGTDYILINKDNEAKDANVQNKIKIDAIVEYRKMTLEDMRKCLRIFGIKSENISSELVESTMFDLIEKDPRRFFTKWVENKEKNTEYIIEAALAKNIMRKNKNIYYYGTEVIGNSLQDAISNLDSVKSQDIKLSIMDEIEYK